MLPPRLCENLSDSAIQPRSNNHSCYQAICCRFFRPGALFNVVNRDEVPQSLASTLLRRAAGSRQRTEDTSKRLLNSWVLSPHRKCILKKPDRFFNNHKMSFDRNPPQPIPAQDTNDKNSSPQMTTLARWARALPEAYVIPVAGGAAGAVSGFVSCPLDVIKTKLQAQGGFKTPGDGIQTASAAYRGIYGTAATIWKEEGFRGMYRGLGPMLLGYVPTWAVYLTVYNKSQAFFRTKTGIHLHTLR